MREWFAKQDAIEVAASLAIEMQFSGVSLYVTHLIEDEEISHKTVWVSAQWQSPETLVSDALLGRQGNLLQDKIKALAVKMRPEWARKTLSISVDSVKLHDLEVELKITAS